MLALYKQIKKEIKKYDDIVIARHIGADPDALGSQFALRELIKINFPEKRVIALGNPASRFKYMGTLDKDDEMDFSKALLIVLDTPDIKRIDINVDINKFSNIIKIDHHPFVEKYASIEVMDEDASSTSQLIVEFILANKLKINDTIAKYLYTGIVSDTDRFLHDYTSKRTFELVNFLLDCGHFKVTSVYEPLYMRPLEEIRFQGYIYQNMEITDNGLAYIKITDDLMKEYKVDSASAGNMINELKFIDKIIVWVFFSEDTKSNLIRANIRSRGPYINELATIYGGGGHKYASGARLTSWKQTQNMIEDLDNLVKEYNDKKEI